jgi:hypothetical protein
VTTSPPTDSTVTDDPAAETEAAAATTPEADPDLDATAAKLAESDAAAFRAEGPRTDTKVTGLLSLMASLVGVTGVLGTLATIRARQSGAPVAAVLISVAAAVLCLGFVLITLVILPKLRRSRREGGGPLGSLVEVSELATVEQARAYYRKAATDPLGHHATAALLHAGLVVGRYGRIRRAGLVLITGIALALAGGLAYSWGW